MVSSQICVVGTFVVLLVAFCVNTLPQDSFSELSLYDEPVSALIKAALNDYVGYERLSYVTNTFGPRLSGSENLENAIDWVLAEMSADGLENVQPETVSVPHWVRNNEYLQLLQPVAANVTMLGLGGSIATPPEGIIAEVLVVRNLTELQNYGEKARGKIVLFNVPFTVYGITVAYRTTGAVWAAQYGAVAALVRSITPFSLNTPHTGVMYYQNGTTPIPSAAITIEAADMLQHFQDTGMTPIVKLYMEAETLPNAISRNVLAEIVGSENPEEIVVIGGHIDSWDVGHGALDDGGGCIAAWEAVRLMIALNLRPKRTIRVVLWTNEENGLQGALTYYSDHLNEINNTVLAIESDIGVFKPTGFSFVGTPQAQAILQNITQLLAPIGPLNVTAGGGSEDISPLTNAGVPGMGLIVQGASDYYFWFHHSPADTVDKVKKDELNQCIAVMAVMSYVVADMEGTLPRT